MTGVGGVGLPGSFRRGNRHQTSCLPREVLEKRVECFRCRSRRYRSGTGSRSLGSSAIAAGIVGPAFAHSHSLSAKSGRRISPLHSGPRRRSGGDGDRLNLFIGMIVSTMQELSVLPDHSADGQELGELLDRMEADFKVLRATVDRLRGP